MKDQNTAAEKIRSQYVAREYTDLDALKALDAKVKRPVRIVACILGVIGVIVMGAGMSLVMTDIGAYFGLEETLIPGVITGIAGLIVLLSAYPIHKVWLGKRKKKFAPQILELSEKLI